jgi:hypothetical protein
LHTDAGNPVTADKTGTDPNGKPFTTYENLNPNKMYSSPNGRAYTQEEPEKVMHLIGIQSLSQYFEK